MHKTGPFTNSGVSKFVKLVVVHTKHQQLNNTILFNSRNNENNCFMNFSIPPEFAGLH